MTRWLYNVMNIYRTYLILLNIANMHVMLLLLWLMKETCTDVTDDFEHVFI